jgi:anthranilate/para-aminobenzoate synthase component I
MVARRRSHPTATVATEPSQTINYDDAVREGKQILADIDSKQDRLMRLGQLADAVETRYGEHKLKDFAKAIGIARCTLERCRSVYRAWAGNEAPAPKSYAVAQELQSHPDRFAIIRENPHLTKRAARKLRHEHRRREEAAARARDDWHREHSRRWFKSMIEHAQELIRDGELAQPENKLLEPLRSSTRAAIQPELLPTLRAAGKAAIRLADFLERLAAEDPKEGPAQETAAVKLEEAAE